MTEELAEKYTKGLLETSRKTDRNAVILALIAAFQSIAIALVQRNYVELRDNQCDKIGLLKQSD